MDKDYIPKLRKNVETLVAIRRLFFLCAENLLCRENFVILEVQTNTDIFNPNIKLKIYDKANISYIGFEHARGGGNGAATQRKRANVAHQVFSRTYGAGMVAKRRQDCSNFRQL